MRKLFSILLLSLVICLSGCATEPAETTAPIEVTDPTHIYEEVRDDFLIDAEVVGFADAGSVTIYEATPRHLTESEGLAFLAANGDDVTNFIVMDDPYYAGYKWDTTRGRLYSETDHNGLFPGTLNYSTSLTDRWDECSIYLSENSYVGNESYRFAHLFTEPKDFAFATAAEAESEVRRRLALLGVDDLTLSLTLYIDHEILANEVTPILRTEEWQSMDKRGYIPTYDDWSEADDGYIFEFYVNIHDTKINSQQIDLDTINHLGGTLVVWYQAPGIVRIYGHYVLWNIGAPVETINSRISAEEALNIARIRLENNKAATNTTVQKISAEYFYVMDGDRFLMRPVWVVTAKVTTKYHFPTSEYISTKTNLHIIDAITGEELA